MRADPSAYQLLAPGTLEATLELMAAEKNQWLPIAGGTDIMVQFAAGELRTRKFVSIWNLPELRRIDVLPHQIEIGAGSTYTDLRKHAILAREFPLLGRAASWTGGIANQNRGTIGGNIVNASPAADLLPALLAYDAELILRSVRGERRLAYREFHTGYKKMRLAADELIQAICIPRRFLDHISYARKVGTRNAQAIAKVGFAALARVEHSVVVDARIAVGSVAPTPIRLTATEAVLNGKALSPELGAAAERSALAEITPITDIRSTAEYRTAVVGNLMAEFVELLRAPGVLARWNQLSVDDACQEIMACCGARAWAQGLTNRRPISNREDLLAAADEVWRSLGPADWMEAFRSHPRIGEPGGGNGKKKGGQTRSGKWSSEEQNHITGEDAAMRSRLHELNAEYERKFGRVFIVGATGKNAAEILRSLERRLANDDQSELVEAAEQQKEITRVRLKKWLSEK
jgi:OHCU decarboxylase